MTKLTSTGSATGHVEKLVSAAGALVGMYALFLISGTAISGIGHYIVISSMGASAVLLFAVPHGPMSQPWPLLGGHTVSAVIGVTCSYLNDPAIAAPLAVAVAIAAMHYLRCMHPPGGATALTAVIGGPDVVSLGFYYVINPVLISAVTIMIVAVCVNYFFPWRRYPATLAYRTDTKHEVNIPASAISHDDLASALKEIGSIVDVTEEDLERIFHSAVNHAQQRGEQKGPKTSTYSAPPSSTKVRR